MYLVVKCCLFMLAVISSGDIDHLPFSNIHVLRDTPSYMTQYTERSALKHTSYHANRTHIISYITILSASPPNPHHSSPPPRPSPSRKPIPLPTPIHIHSLILALLPHLLALVLRRMSRRRRIRARLVARAARVVLLLLPLDVAARAVRFPRHGRPVRGGLCWRRGLCGSGQMACGGGVQRGLLELVLRQPLLVVLLRAPRPVGVDAALREVVGAATGDDERAPAVTLGVVRGCGFVVGFVNLGCGIAVGRGDDVGCDVLY